mmetsp:Transcript_9197/g.12166  ORF Transcript_9197/g.12166 Transcript_9197/m.12166 type:complete len:258 (-) Transcript_9197:176-949(-)
MGIQREVLLKEESVVKLSSTPEYRKRKDVIAEVSSPVSPRLCVTGGLKCVKVVAEDFSRRGQAAENKAKAILRQTYGSKKKLTRLTLPTGSSYCSQPPATANRLPFSSPDSLQLCFPLSQRKRKRAAKKSTALGSRSGLLRASVSSSPRKHQSDTSTKGASEDAKNKLQKLNEFFSNLDTRHLQKAPRSGLPDEDYLPGNLTVRTRRKGAFDYLQDSYKEYQKALSGVSSPIPFEDFAKNHLLFSDSGHLYDGILDV